MDGAGEHRGKMRSDCLHAPHAAMGTIEENRMTGPIIFFVMLFCPLCLLTPMYSLPVKDSLLWGCGVFLLFYVPGNLLIRQYVFRNNHFLHRLFYSLALGMAVMPVIYTLFRKLQVPNAFFFFMIGASLAWLVLLKKDIRPMRDCVISKYDAVAFCALSCLAFLLLHLSYFTDIIFIDNGFNIRTDRFTETIFHLGIINNLVDQYPPLHPYASGFNLSFYHLNMHMEIEMFHRIFSIDTLKLAFFYFPLLYFTLFIMLPYFCILEIGGTRLIGVSISVLLFGSDLSFIMGIFGKVPWDYPWITIYNPAIWSILTLNGILPALIVMSLFIIILHYYDKSRKLNFLLLLSVLAYSAYGFKSSMGLHLMGSLFVAGIAAVIITRDSRKGIELCSISAITLAVIFLDFSFFRNGSGGMDQKITVDAFHSFRQSLMKLGISELPWYYYPLLFLNYVVASFGARSLGFLSLKDSGRQDRDTPSGLLVVFVTIFVTSGFILSQVISIGGQGLDMDDAMWFSIQSLFGAWLLVSFYLINKRLHQKRLAALIFIIMLFSLPSTIQYLSLRYNSGYHAVNSTSLEVIRFLKTVPADSVVLHPLNNEPSLASNFAGRSSIINTFRSFVPYHIGNEGVTGRMSDVESFFSTGSPSNRSSILKKYHVDYVYAPVAFRPLLDREIMLYEVFKNDEYVVYKTRQNIF